MKRIGFLKTKTSSEVKESYMSIDFGGLDRELFKPEMCYDLLSKTGVKYARCQTGWVRCEKEKGVYDFEWLDEVIDNLISRGVIPWFNVSYGNPIYMPDAPNSTAVGCVPIYYGEEVISAWCNYVEALTKHFRDRVTHYEIWNEPDISQFWYPEKSNGKEYAKFVKLTADVIKRFAPDAKIGICVSSPFHFDFIEDALSTLPAGSIDFFCYHLYSRVPEFRFPQVVKHLRASLDKHGFENTELWQGEGGYPSWAYEGHWLVKEGCDDERPQAKWQLRRYFLDVYHGAKRSSFFHTADMWEKPYEKATETLKKPAAQGVLNGKVYTPKKSYETITNLASIFSGDILPTREYMHVDIPEGSSEELVSIQMFSFKKNGYPIYAYYLPLSLAEMHEINYSTKMCVTGSIESPVLIDPYTGEVFEVDAPEAKAGMFRYSDLIIRDYPVIITDKKVFEITED